jgi:NTP pyrophosphatase (non-canonical NTP hydrolase)
MRPGIAVPPCKAASRSAGLHHPPLGSAAALAEEVGELSKHLVDHHCYGKAFDRAAFGAELADVLICVAELATLHGVDLQDADAREDRRRSKRLAPKWRTQLGGAFERAWKIALRRRGLARARLT